LQDVIVLNIICRRGVYIGNHVCGHEPEVVIFNGERCCCLCRSKPYVYMAWLLCLFRV